MSQSARKPTNKKNECMVIFLDINLEFHKELKNIKIIIQVCSPSLLSVHKKVLEQLFLFHQRDQLMGIEVSIICEAFFGHIFKLIFAPVFLEEAPFPLEIHFTPRILKNSFNNFNRFTIHLQIYYYTYHLPNHINTIFSI